MTEKEKLASIGGHSCEDFIQSLENGTAKVKRFPTGFPKLDEILGGGLREGSVNIIQAESTIGKTALALQMVSYWAKHNVKVLYFDLDNPVNSCKFRLIGREFFEMALAETGSETKAKALTKDLSVLEDDEQRERMTETEKKLWKKAISVFKTYENNLYFFDEIKSIVALRNKVKTAVECFEGKPAILVLDYLQIVPGDPKEDERVNITNIVRGLSFNNCVVLALASTPKSAQGTKKARMTDGFGSVSVLYDSFALMQLVKKGNSIVLHLLKNKEGNADKEVHFRFIRERGYFIEEETVSTEQEEQMRAFQEMMG